MRLQIAQRTDLALRALRLLETDGGKLRATELGPELATTPQYLPQVLRPLVRASWLESEPGPTGGYRLAVRLNEHSLLELIELLEGPTDAGTCVLRGGNCNEDAPCSMHGAWSEVREVLTRRLTEIPISGRGKGESR